MELGDDSDRAERRQLDLDLLQQRPSQLKPQPDEDQAQYATANGVKQGGCPESILPQREGFEAVGRKRGKSPQEANYQKKLEVVAQSTPSEERHENADEQTSHQVDRPGAEGQ